ncbi:MAG: hypothetical protein OEN55_17945 [Alphaproteobacteria bacterium]|nr:hypothetical protein [Alphaproteobacteria bacterium]
MIRHLVLLAAALLSWAAAGPARAQTTETPQAVYDSFDALLGGREQREFYALPPERYWRATGPVQLRLAGGRDFGLAPALVALADEFGRVTGVEIGVQASALAMMPEAGKAGDLTVLIVARPLGVEFAAGLGIDTEMRRRFADGRWPALFRFRRDDLSPTGRRSGIVLVADDLEPAEIETFLALAMVWSMGGASIGDELGAIVSIAGRPQLTERGRQVFALMYDPQLELALPLDEARSRARRVLGLAD